MIYKKVEVLDIIAFLGSSLLTVHGNSRNITIDNIADASNTTETSLDWIRPDRANKQMIAENSASRVLLVDKSVEYNEELKRRNKTLLVVTDPKIALAKIGNHFFVEKGLPGIDVTAQIAPDAIIGENVYIGPNSVIGKATIGENCRIDANVRIHDNVIMGTDCEVKAGAVLGGSGFGYERDEHGNLFRFPQIGDLIIGNNVEIGSNTTIDRGALSDTVIGDYTKINNLCHIAHNNQIGKNVIITGCVNISGSNIIKDNVWIAPNSCIRGWIEIGQNAVIGAGAVVTKNIPAGETWVGNPAKKLLK